MIQKIMCGKRQCLQYEKCDSGLCSVIRNKIVEISASIILTLTGLLYGSA